MEVWERKKQGGEVEDEEGGEMKHKSDKIAAITISIEALCNLCLAVE